MSQSLLTNVTKFSKLIKLSRTVFFLCIFLDSHQVWMHIMTFYQRYTGALVHFNN